MSLKTENGERDVKGGCLHDVILAEVHFSADCGVGFFLAFIY